MAARLLDADRAARSDAARVLDGIGWSTPEALAAIQRADVLEQLCGYLDNEDRPRRRDAAHVLSRLGWAQPDVAAVLRETGVVARLVDRMHDLDEERWRDAVTVLEGIGWAQVRRYCPSAARGADADRLAEIVAARSPEPWSSLDWEDAALTLAEWGDPRAAAPLRDLVDHFRKSASSSREQADEARRSWDRSDDEWEEAIFSAHEDSALRSAAWASAHAARAEHHLRLLGEPVPTS
jgi:hypothetical protein